MTTASFSGILSSGPFSSITRERETNRQTDESKNRLKHRHSLLLTFVKKLQTVKRSTVHAHERQKS